MGGVSSIVGGEKAHGGGKMVIAAIALAVLTLGGCSMMQSRPQQPEQYALIEAAKATALAGCNQLAAEALSDRAAGKLRASLVALGSALEHSDPATLGDAIAEIDVNVAPYAPAISALAWLAVAQIPPDEAEATYYVVIRGVVDGCAAGLGTVV